ncbi:hypothetical protein ACUHMQ_00680 [Chitinimonas sp. PSY-7]|uniref:hypothetical protein n=1 Tax=Chitinimonas sp. PSY-7 TaxID=3459088 RepID=UPI00403FDC28
MTFDNLLFLIVIGLLAAFSLWRSFVSKTYGRSWLICTVLLLCGLFSDFVVQTTTYVDANGVLHELWPLPVVTGLLLLGAALNIAVLVILQGYLYVKRRWWISRS